MIQFARLIAAAVLVALAAGSPGHAAQEPAPSMRTSIVSMTMRDGVEIAARIYLPTAPGKYPTLLAASPYRFDNNKLPASQQFLWRETGPIDWYVDKGYAFVHVDVRGSGRSGGEYRYLDSNEQRDFYEIIEWIAEQTWSNGKVGGIGQSYYAMVQWWMGIQNPPHLSCIAPYDGFIDTYRDTAYQGGIAGSFFASWWDLVRSINWQPAEGNARAIPFDLGYHLKQHTTYDAFWRERSAYEHLDKIKVPVFSIGIWAKMNLHLRGNIRGYQMLQSPRKLMITGAENAFVAVQTFDDPDFHERVLLPFYEWCLKGKDNGFMQGPNVRYWLRGADQYIAAESWPPKGVNYRKYFLGGGKTGSVTSLNDGGLATVEPSAEGGATSYQYPNPGWVLGVAGFGKRGPDPVRRVLTFTSDILDEDITIAGPIKLVLYASSTNQDTDFIVKLSDQSPQNADQRAKDFQPNSVIVSKGWLKASHRALDPERGTEYVPFHPHENPEPLEPGKIYKFEIEVMPAAYVIRKGHRIRLEVANGDSAITDFLFVHYYHPHKIGADTIHHNEQHPSYILLPVIEG